MLTQIELDYMQTMMAEMRKIAKTQAEIAESLKTIAEAYEPDAYEKIRRKKK